MFTRVLDDTFDRHVPALQARRRDARHSQRQRDFALPPRLYRAEPCAAAAHRRSPAAATVGAATDASFPPPPASRRRRRGVVAAVVVAVATTTAVAATTVAAATDTVDRKEARVVRARAHALPRMRIERERPVSLFLPPLRSVSARAASSSPLPLPPVALVAGVRYRPSSSSHFLLTRLMPSIFSPVIFFYAHMIT